ncbi:glycolate oxidase subunit GlcF [Massilia sp. TS11]|uniref:glycolate oxidase subunit GlcF n=1 Tax=Massilia sp. TS11 TaxID=2908003 RepID=UPI001EDB6CC2|nr:glycolate oxidase subunit GlcF [Massilia sp. TS11]MCG2585382.1 glycolate oxidase subunit GlcF [Massilia sp. TS11]
MQTKLADFIRATPEGEEAESILRACVHCGFCTATCPTYQLLGDERDGPRGRIYLIKQVLEGGEVTRATQLHLDRCLSCRNCESTCPSGVRYGRLLDIGRKVVEDKVGRPAAQQALRTLLKESLTRPWVFTPAVQAGRLLRPLLPRALRAKLMPAAAAGPRPQRAQARQMLLLEGCVQPGLAPNINAATARVLDACGVQLISPAQAGCCGALRYHLNDQAGGLDDMRRNIDAWTPYLDTVEAIVITASGCGLSVKEYGHLLAHDPAYAERAARVSALARDVVEVLAEFTPLFAQRVAARGQRVAYHPPCTLQHGQQIRGAVEGLLRAVGVEVALCADSHLCCGSAGTYALLQPQLSQQLRARKLENLAATGAAEVVTANIGCISQLQGGAQPVRHWIELLDELLA